MNDRKQTYGANYFDTYAPVVTWFAVRLMIIFDLVFRWTLKQIDFIMTYPRTPIKGYLYMDITHDIFVKNSNSCDYTLKLLVKIYDQKQGGQV